MNTVHDTPGRSDDPAAPLLARAQTLVTDLSLSSVHAWKTQHPDGLIVGYMPIYIPRPLLEALGCLPVSLFGGGDQVDIIKGDSYFQSYICHIPRSTIELLQSHRYDVLDAVLFPSICDVIRNLSGMWKLLHPQQLAEYVDLPQNFSPDIGGRFYRLEMQRIASALTSRGARPLTDDALREACARENVRRAAIRDMDAIRARQPWRIAASEAYLIIRAGGVLDTVEHTELIRAFTAAVAERKPRIYDNVRVIVVGSFCEQPPIDLIRTLEKAGCDILDDDFQLGLRLIEGDIDTSPNQDPLSALAAAFIDHGAATASRYIADCEKGAALVHKVRTLGADGVIFAAASFCDPALLDQPMLEAALDRADIPYTAFKFSENTGQFQVIREQAGAFSDSVKLWGKVA
ncbi:MAG: benzoyl-CoA reductase subunit C [Myxococcales bacterium]|nr:benzoyl-CoA reductase subunit C [Myxococcales bacterium]